MEILIVIGVILGVILLINTALIMTIAVFLVKTYEEKLPSLPQEPKPESSLVDVPKAPTRLIN